MTEKIRLDPKNPGKFSDQLKQALREHIVGQERALNHLVRRITYANSLEGRLRNHRKPAGSFMYLGPTGVGKTRLVEVLAYLMFGSFDAMTKIDCSELQERHEISRLIGAPPGYVGYDDEPWLNQKKLDYWGYLSQQPDFKARKHYERLFLRIEDLQKRLKTFQEKNKDKSETKVAITKNYSSESAELQKEFDFLKKEKIGFLEKYGYKPASYPAILLFDEIEKANKSLFNLLLQIHDKAKLTLHGSASDGDDQVLFHNTLIFYTSNLAQRQIKKMLESSNIGFSSAIIADSDLDTRIYKVVFGEMGNFFSPEFLGRIGKENIISFTPLSRSDIREGLDRIIIPGFIGRLSKTFPISITITEKARDFIVDESFDSRNKTFGMRSVEEVFLKNLEEKIVCLMEKDLNEAGISIGDNVFVDVVDGGLEFSVQKDLKKQQISSNLTDEIEKKIKETGIREIDRKRIAIFKFRNFLK